MQDCLKGFNEWQWDAVLATEGLLMIAAGAGQFLFHIYLTNGDTSQPTNCALICFLFSLLGDSFRNKSAQKVKKETLLAPAELNGNSSDGYS